MKQVFCKKWTDVVLVCGFIFCMFVLFFSADMIKQKSIEEKAANAQKVKSFYQLLAEHKVQSMKWSINSGDRTMKKYYPFTLNEHDSLAVWQDKALSDYKIFLRAMQDTLDSRGEFDFLRGFEYGLKKGQTDGK